MASVEAFPVLVFVFVGVLAAGSSLLAMINRFDLGTRIIMAMWSFVTWAIWSLQATDLVELSHGEAFHYSLGSLMYIGLGGAFIMLLFVVRGAVHAINGDTTNDLDTVPQEDI